MPLRRRAPTEHLAPLDVREIHGRFGLRPGHEDLAHARTRDLLEAGIEVDERAGEHDFGQHRVVRHERADGEHGSFQVLAGRAWGAYNV